MRAQRIAANWSVFKAIESRFIEDLHSAFSTINYIINLLFIRFVGVPSGRWKPHRLSNARVLLTTDNWNSSEIKFTLFIFVWPQYFFLCAVDIEKNCNKKKFTKYWTEIEKKSIPIAYRLIEFLFGERIPSGAGIQEVLAHQPIRLCINCIGFLCAYDSLHTMMTRRFVGRRNCASFKWSMRSVQLTIIGLLIANTIERNEAVDWGKCWRLN